MLTCVAAGPLYVVVEYAPHGNLREFLHGCRAVCDGWTDDEQLQSSSLPAVAYKDLLSFAFQVARGLEYMSAQMVNVQNVISYCYMYIFNSKRSCKCRKTKHCNNLQPHN